MRCGGVHKLKMWTSERGLIASFVELESLFDERFWGKAIESR